MDFRSKFSILNLNFHSIQQLIENIWRGAKRRDSLDHFKSVNDEFGHQSGDKVLTEFCRRLRDNVRPYDSIGRYGGEEFLVVFPETDAPRAFSQSERMRQSISQLEFQLNDEARKTITTSIGVATFDGEEDIKALIERADKALYQAKSEGRNKTVAAP